MGSMPSPPGTGTRGGKGRRTLPVTDVRQEETRMYGTIRRYKIARPREFTEKVNSSFINVVRKVPGFISYIAIDEGDGWWASVSLFEGREGIVESDRVAAEWVAQQAPGMVTSGPEITEGVVVVK
jgi:hypothetical protein